ncbi:MAG TPA: glycosyltransferase family 2 protein [Bacteroidales bacterium]|nr:glycosyltransferase family 2 protein [Bacteroidales bacterium]
MKEPLVSVIIPTYNREHLIVKAIDSVMKQTFQDFEILIIDDASTDNTIQVLKNLNNPKVQYYQLEKNGGQCIARNYGIKRAKGKYIAFLDSDDEWLPHKLEKQIECFSKGPKNLGSVYSYSYSKDMIKNRTTLIQGNYYRGNIYNKLIQGFCPPTPSLFMIKKEALEKVNYFDEKLITFVDLDLHIRIAKNYLFDYVEEPLIIKYEQIGDQYVNNFEKRYKGYGLFKKKWEKEIVTESGKDKLKNLKSNLVYSIAKPMLYHPPKNLQKNIPKLIKLLLEIKSTRTMFYFKAILIFIFGPGIIYTIRRQITKAK